MGVSNYDTINAIGASAKVVAALPTTPASYYGSTNQDTSASEWAGGELVYLTTEDRLYIQMNTSGTTASWVYLNDAFASTSSTSTSTSTSTTSSSSTSTSSTTSTSTSTSSSTSTSTSTSSTTTA